MAKINGIFRSIAAASVFAVLPMAAHAATVHFKATLDAASEVPAKDSAGKGMLTATLNTNTHEFKYHVVFSGLTGPAVAAHFHGPAAPGANAGPVVPVKGSPLASPIEGTATLTPDQEKDLEGGQWYFNLHTAANPGGEVRGQVMESK